MIQVTRLNKSQIVLNADMIKTIEATPDTVITLNNDEKLVVIETVDEIVDKIIKYRRKIFKGLFNLEKQNLSDGMENPER